ncbi:MAG TPA: T9SS type A sorting domain-containing protein [Edaphocola sp.]|nr:T9SS type A sorting domain-containing protein [Edaphocola sp.]
MKFYYYIIGIVFLFFVKSIHLNAQNKDYYGFSKTFVYTGDSLRRFGGNFSNILYLNNSENLIFTNTSITLQNKHLNQWFKIDKNGSIIFQTTDSFGYASNYYILDIEPNNNDPSSYFATGWYDNYIDKKRSVVIENRDTSLSLNWRKVITLNEDTVVMNTFILSFNKKLLIGLNTGIIDSLNPGQYKKVFIWIWETDTLGNIIWKKTVEETEWNNLGGWLKTSDGNILIYGRTSGYGVSTSTLASGYVMKIDTAGNKLWHKVYLLPEYNGIEKIIATADGNYICAGWGGIEPEKEDMLNGVGRIIKINDQGNIIWDKIINISPRTETFWDIISTENNDLITIGASSKYYAYDIYNYEVGNTRAPDGWALKIDLDGNIKWSRVIGHNAIPHAHDYLYNAVPLPDGGFIASGSTMIKDSTWWNNGEPIYAMRQSGWVVKLDSMGCLGPGCPEMLADYIDSMKNPKPPIEHLTEITLYPNPGGNQAILENKAGFSEEAFYYISDMQGKIIQDQTPIDGQTQVKIDLRGHAAASYIVRVYHDYGYYSFKYAKKE